MQAQDPVKTPCGMTRQPKAVHQGLTIEQLTLYTQAVLHEHALRPTSVKQGHVRQPHDTTLFVPLIQYTISPGQRFWLTEAYLDTATPQLPQKPALFSTASATLPVESEEDLAIALTRYLGLYDDTAQDIIDRRDCVLEFLDRNAIQPSRVLDDTRAEGAHAQQYSIDLPGPMRINVQPTRVETVHASKENPSKQEVQRFLARSIPVNRVSLTERETDIRTKIRRAISREYLAKLVISAIETARGMRLRDGIALLTATAGDQTAYTILADELSDAIEAKVAMHDPANALADTPL